MSTIHTFPDNHTELVAQLFYLLIRGVWAGKVRKDRIKQVMELAASSHCGTVQLMIDELSTKLGP